MPYEEIRSCVDLLSILRLSSSFPSLTLKGNCARIEAPSVGLASQCHHYCHSTWGIVMVEDDKSERIGLKLFGVLVGVTLKQLTEMVSEMCDISLKPPGVAIGSQDIDGLASLPSESAREHDIRQA